MNDVAGHADLAVERAIAALERLAHEAPSSSELAVRWQDFETTLLAQLREEERALSPLLDHPAQARRAIEEHERIRNLAWEVAVSADLGCVHVLAIRKLRALLHARSQRSQRSQRSSA